MPGLTIPGGVVGCCLRLSSLSGAGGGGLLCLRPCYKSLVAGFSVRGGGAIRSLYPIPATSLHNP